MNELSATFAAEVVTVTAARHFVRDAMLAWNLPELSDDAQLGTSELVANAVIHARTEYTLTVRRDEDIVIEIRDGDPDLHRPTSPVLDPTADHGRGLQIIAAISSDWGISSSTTGKCVWFALSIPEQSRAGADLFSFSDAQARGDEEQPRATGAG